MLVSCVILNNKHLGDSLFRCTFEGALVWGVELPHPLLIAHHCCRQPKRDSLGTKSSQFSEAEMPQLLPGKGWLRKAYLNMKNIMGKHHGETSYHTKVKVVSGKFAMGKRVERDGLVQPIRAELCHGKMCYTYTLFNKATNGL